MPASSSEHIAADARLRVDVVVVGAGVAGLVAALDLIDARPGTAVAVLDKGVIGTTGSTPLAQGGMAAAVGPDDSPGLHVEDTIRAGDGLCDTAAVAVVAAEAPARVDDLLARGAQFDRRTGGALHLAREGAQTVPRCVHARDATGAEIFRTLRSAATGRVTRLQGIASEIAVDRSAAPPRAVGVWALLDDAPASPAGPAQEGGTVLLRADAVMLATGGCGGLYAATTNRAGATGDGVALAWRAGAALVDLEFVQFHPTGLRMPPSDGDPSWRLLLTEALRGAGAVLVDARGRRFMLERHPDADLAPRHLVARGILDQPDGAWLDATSLGADRLAEEFPTVLAGVRQHGFDLAAEPVPVEPTQHYMIGGVATDLDGATSVAGLYAAGEAACTGVHGANRVAGNSLAQSCVFGHRAAVAMARALEATTATTADPVPPAADADAACDAGAIRATLRRAMSAGAGPLRTAESLESTAKELDRIADTLGNGRAGREAIELGHALATARLIVRSATLRRESRGVHWREDAPGPRTEWAGARIRVGRTNL